MSTDQPMPWRGTRSVPFWLDKPHRPPPRPVFDGDDHADLVVVGGGFTGLWTALRAKERNPGRDVLLLDGGRIGWAASGRNGGFCSASLTHGRENGLRHFPEEYEQLHRLGIANLDEIEKSVRSYGIECDFERSGTLSVAFEPWQESGMDHGGAEVLRGQALQDEIRSPRYTAGVWEREGSALVDPAELVWGLARTCEALGVRIHENSPVLSWRRHREGVALRTPHGTLVARSTALATNAYRSLVRSVRLHTVPVHDYVLVTEPLDDNQLEAVGWRHRQGLSERSNQFHYSRLTRDNRILWGGYDAIYHYGRRPRSRHDSRAETFDVLAEQLVDTFPALAGIGFTHAWGGAIDTSTRFCAFYGTTAHGRMTYSLGFTGLGVGASRFAADVMLDLLAGDDTERTRLTMVRKRPLPFPPEPLAYGVIQLTRRSLQLADANGGRRDLWLRTLDRLGLGFDS